MTGSYQADLETTALKAQIETLERRWREDAAERRTQANNIDLVNRDYAAGYADALDRCVQAISALEEEW